MTDSVSYQERIVVLVDERQFNASLQKAERDYQSFLQRLARQKNIELQVSVRDNATRSFQNISRTAQNLTRSRQTVTVAARDDATTTLRSVQRTAQQLTRSPVTVRVNVAGNAQQQISSLRASMSGLARSPLTLPVRAAGNVAGQLAPEVAGMASPAIGGAMLAGGAAAGVLAVGTAMGVSTNSAMDFNRQIVQVQNNTTMTNAEVATLRTNVLDLSNQFGLSQEPLITAARQIQDLTQNATAMNGIMSVAAETAAATGADVGQVGQVLANTLHQYRMDQGDATTVTQNAAHAMGVLHLASAEGNMTMQQFADSSGRAIALAGQLGVPLEQVTGALAALTRNGFDASQAQTQLVNIFTRIVRPAADAEKQIKALSTSSGVDLVSAFTAQGLQQLGLTGVFARTTEAYRRMGMTQGDAVQESLNLMNAQRGGIGAALLMGKGADDLNHILTDLTNTQLTDTYVSQAWARAQEQPATQFDILGQRIHTTEIAIGDFFIPAVMRAFQWSGQLVGPLGDVAREFGALVGPIVGVNDPLNTMDTIVQDAVSGLSNFSTWLGAVRTEAQQNGALDELHTAFKNVLDAIGPLVDLLNPLRTGLGGANSDLATTDTSSHGAASGLKSFGDAAVAVTAEIQPFIDAIKAIETTLNNISQLGTNITPHMPVAGQNQAGAIAVGRAQVEQAAGEGVTPVQAVQNMWDYWFGGRQARIQQAQAALVDPSAEIGQQIANGMTQGMNTNAPDVSDEARKLAQNAIKSTQDELDSHSPSGRFTTEGENIVLGLAQGITNQSQSSLPNAVQDMVTLIKDQFQNAMSQGGTTANIAGNVSGTVNDWIAQATKQAGVDPNAWAGGLQAIIQHESGGDPNAANMGDVNAQAGNPSRGLMQLTGTNRQHYTPAGMDPMDPVAQIVAGIGYIRDRYGDIGNVPGVRSLAAGGAYKPYQAGGVVTEPSIMVSARTGRAWGTIAESAPERVLPTRMSAIAAGGVVASNSFAPVFQITQQPGEDGEALAARISTHLQSVMPTYFHRFSQHIGESLGNIPQESFS